MLWASWTARETQEDAFSRNRPSNWPVGISLNRVAVLPLTRARLSAVIARAAEAITSVSPIISGAGGPEEEERLNEDL